MPKPDKVSSVFRIVSVDTAMNNNLALCIDQGRAGDMCAPKNAVPHYAEQDERAHVKSMHELERLSRATSMPYCS